MTFRELKGAQAKRQAVKQSNLRSGPSSSLDDDWSSVVPLSMKIDIHTHILPSSWPETEGVELRLRQTGESDGSAIMEWKDGTFFRKVKRNCFDGAKIVALR